MAVGPETARALGLQLGDRTVVGKPGVPETVVGLALFPVDLHSEFREGVWLHRSDFDRIRPPESGRRYLAARLAVGADPMRVTAKLQTVAGEGYAAPAEVPPELTNLRNVRRLPELLAAVLCLLATAALAHMLVTSTRLGARDFATARAIGMTRWQRRLVLHAQSTAVVLLGLVLGLPLGVALGRAGWQLVAKSVPLERSSPIALEGIALLVPGALIAVQLAAWATGGRASRPHPDILRAD